MIRVLPPEVVNQIAAGEVVERPFSVVKELVENSLDAGASKVVVELHDGGKERIVVLDDGAGFTPADLELAFVSHATSKLGALADLDHIASLGFRGEALASMGSIARATIRSRTEGADSGHEITCEGGALGAVRPSGCPRGTRVEIADLFFNTPARRRFLKTGRAERARIQELLGRLALARLDVDFTLLADGAEALRLPAGESLRERLVRVVGRRVADHLVEVDRAWGNLRVHGLVGRPEIARRDSSLALLWINGRLARDRGAQASIRQAYREFLMHGSQPVHFLMVEMPPDEVDVNVHPAKAEVRFLDARRVQGLVHEAARAALTEAGERPRTGAGAVQVGEGKPRALTGLPSLPGDLFGRDTVRSAASSAGVSTPPAGIASRATGGEPAAERSAPGAAEGLERAPDAESTDAEPRDAVAVEPVFARIAGARFVQALDLYWVFATDDGLVVIDQHALHERVMYERLRARHDAGAPAIQRLLVPEVVELGAREKAWLLGHAETLAAEGLLVDDFGGAAVAIHGVPAVLSRVRPRSLVESLVGDLDDEDAEALPRLREAVVERFHSRACRSSVMAGDRLDDREVEALLEEASRCEHPHNCPHGRPTVLTFSGEELERFFKRTC